MTAETLFADKDEGRIDTFLTRLYPEFSRTYFQYLIREKKVVVNDQIVKKSYIVMAGDEIELQFIVTEEIGLEPENIPLTILYEDTDILAVNKPAGLVVHPAPSTPKHTFVNALLYYCKTLEQDDSLRPGIVHRLDKDTTGVLVAAKTRKAHTRLVELFSKREVKKIYLAICHGKPKEGLVDAPLKRHPKDRKKMTVQQGGKEARSHITVLSYNDKYSLCEIELETGRTHQIRAHLTHLGHPIVGDTLYGSKHPASDRQLLHASSIAFFHPITKVLVEITATLPDDFLSFKNREGL